VFADIGMPKIDGIQMLKIMRSAPQTAMIPVILMTGMPIPDRLLEAAAENLKAGPIHVKGDFNRLFDRINNSPRFPAQGTPAADPHLFHKGPVTADLIRREVIVAGRQAPHLTAKRFDVLLCLLRHDGLVDQDVLLSEVWGHKGNGDLRTVRVTILRLREDLRDFPALQIKTEGHSYQLVVTALPTEPGV
jgi:two-component system alkaline phosphatase synthesis response regulator PhoP